MGKEVDDDGVFSLQGFNGQQLSAAIGNLKVQDDRVRWMGAAPRTPLRALIARECRSFRALAQTTDPALLLLKSSPGRNRDEEAAGDGLAGIRWSPLDGLKAASSGRRSGLVKAKGGGSPSPPSGCSSPRSFGTRLGLSSSHKSRAFKKVAATPPKPVAEDLRSVKPMAGDLRSVQQQLGALLATEREEPRDITAPEEAEADGAIVIENGPPSPRDSIDAEELARTGAPNAGEGSSFRSPSPGNENRATKSTGGTESQELRYLFAKDWALQTSDEDDEFWDSGSLCGVSVVSPSPRSGHDQRRRRTKNLNSSKREEPGHSYSSRRSQPFTSSPRTGTWTQSNHPLSTTSSQRIDEFLERHVENTSHGDSCRLQSEAHGSKSSLGTLLAEEIATSRSASSLGLGSAEPTWSVPTCSDNIRRPKIGSLSDISAPVRPESKSQLDFLIAKILALRANSMETNKSSSSSSSSSSPAPSLSADDGGGCSTSGSLMPANTGAVRVVDHGSFCRSPSSGGNLSTTVGAPNILQMMDPPSPEIKAATTPQKVPHSSSSLVELLTTSTVGETTCAALITVTDAGEIASRHEVDDANEASQVMARSSSAAADNDVPEVEAAAVSGPERVPLGTLLERARVEHRWLPLCLSRMGSPLNQAGSQAPASSNTSLWCNNFTAPPDENWHHSSECFVPSRSSSPTAGSLELDNNHPLTLFQQSANLVANSTTDANSASLPGDASAAAAVARAGAGAGAPTSERPPTQRVSLLSLLNQDMEMEFEDGSLLHLEVAHSGVDEEEPAETEELDPMCCVCMVGHKGAAFIPCGHTFCRKCCREVRRSIGSCPLCNQAIVDVLKLY